MENLITLMLSALITAIPTFFITRKYGRNLKRDWWLIFLPCLILGSIVFYIMGDVSRPPGTIGGIIGATLPGGLIGYFSTRGKKGKLKNS